MRKKDRDFTVFSLSFLDCISCGFGAVLLLFVLTLGAGPQMARLHLQNKSRL